MRESLSEVSGGLALFVWHARTASQIALQDWVELARLMCALLCYHSRSPHPTHPLTSNDGCRCDRRRCAPLGRQLAQQCAGHSSGPVACAAHAGQEGVETREGAGQPLRAGDIVLLCSFRCCTAHPSDIWVVYLRFLLGVPPCRGSCVLGKLLFGSRGTDARQMTIQRYPLHGSGVWVALVGGYNSSCCPTVLRIAIPLAEEQVARLNRRALRDGDVVKLAAKRAAKVAGTGRYRALTPAALLRIAFGVRLFEPPKTRTAP